MIEQVFKEGLRIIAEIGGNHGGDVELAKQMVDAAVSAGADAVKFQTYVPDLFLSPEHDFFESFKKESLSFDEFRLLKEYCDKKDILFISTPFDIDSVDFLDAIGMNIFKIASGDITSLPLIEHIAKKSKPIILSIGSCNWDESDTAVRLITENNSAGLAVLHCTAAYPAPDNESNLLCIPEVANRYPCVPGFSDHTLGISISLGAVALGARIIEKHFTTDKSLPGGDNDMSITPQELYLLGTEGRRIYKALYHSDKCIMDSEKEIAGFIRRSVYTYKDIAAGEVFTHDNLIIRRPGGGVQPAYYKSIVGEKAKRFLAKNTLLKKDDY